MTKISKSLILALIIFFINTTGAKAIMVDKMVVSCKDQKIERVLAGDIFNQSFVSETDEFGIVAVKFSNFSDTSSDVLIFRIKESSQDGWYYESHYKVDQFQNDQYFPFGFPVISNALGKEYIFELESLSGTVNDSIGVHLSQDDCYKEGALHINKTPTNKDIIFKTIQGVPFIKQLKNDIFLHISNDLGFFLFWSATMAAIILLIRKH